MSKRPVKKIVLARNIDLKFFTEDEYDMFVRLLGPRDYRPAYIWKLTLVARVPFAQEPKAVAYIKPMI